jgi:hypothetical protein
MELKTSIPLLVVGLEMRLLSTPATAVRRESSGRGGATDPHGHCGMFGCEFQPTQDGEASGRDPEVLHACGINAMVYSPVRSVKRPGVPPENRATRLSPVPVNVTHTR